VLSVALIAAAAGVQVLHRRALAWCAAGLLIWAQFHWLVNHTDDSEGTFLALAWGLMALGVLGERYFAALRVPVAGPFTLAASAVTFAVYIQVEAALGWRATWWAVGACGLMAFAGVTRGRTAGALGLAGLVLASLGQFAAAVDQDLPTVPLVAGFVAPAIGWIAAERAARMIATRIGLPNVDLRTVLIAFPALATALLAFMLFKLPLATTYYLTLSWCGLGLALFGMAVTFKEKTYRYCGLAVLGLATLRAAFIDTRELEALPRIFALGGLGLVLLTLGYAYVRVFARTTTPVVPSDES
jgi:hypothetical protein